MAQYTNVTVKDDRNQTVISGATADKAGSSALDVTSTRTPYPTLEVGANYSIDADPSLHELGEFQSQNSDGVFRFKVDFGG